VSDAAQSQRTPRSYRIWSVAVFIAGVLLLRNGFLHQRANHVGRYKFTDRSMFGWQAMAVGIVLIIAAVILWRVRRR